MKFSTERHQDNSIAGLGSRGLTCRGSCRAHTADSQHERADLRESPLAKVAIIVTTFIKKDLPK